MKKKLVLVSVLGMMILGALMPSGKVLAVEGDASGSGTSTTSGGSGGCDQEFFGLRPWHYGLTEGADCKIKSPTGCTAGAECTTAADDLSKFIWTIVLNVLVDLFMIAGIVALGFLIYGGYLYLRSGGDPGFAARGQKTITAALVGLVIVTLANAISRLFSTVLTDVRGDGTAGGVQGALNWVYAVMGVVAVIGIIYGAVMWTTSQGDPAKVKKGRDAILYAVIGLAIVLLAVAITNVVVGAMTNG